MKFWGIITARKNSKRLLNKNIKTLINKPLIEYTYINTINTLFDKIILSTDCDECINIASNYNHIEVPFKRPNNLSLDNSTSIDVVKHCLDYYINLNIDLPDYIFILQPTTPQRKNNHINYIINYLKIKNNNKSLSTVSKIENMKVYSQNNRVNDLYYENGLIFAISIKDLYNNFNNNYIKSSSLPYEDVIKLNYPEEEIVDIDTIKDFNYAEFLIKQSNKNKKFRPIVIGDRIIDEKSKPFVIAEIGINHNSDFKKASKMIYDAYYAGCECVKFQCHIPNKEMSNDAKNIIPINCNESIYSVIEKSSFNEQEELMLKNLVESLGMIYLCTPFSKDAVDRLERLNVQAYKIGSGEMNNLDLVEYIAKLGKPIFISTGMNSLQKIRQTVYILDKYDISYSLFHCVSMYPTPYNKVNLPGLDDLQNEFPEILIGLSDHSIGITSCLGAYMKGCQIFEKHYTSYNDWQGPDIEISITPKELKSLIKQLDILKDCNVHYPRNYIQAEEENTIKFAFSTLTFNKDLKKNDIVTINDIYSTRPNVGDYTCNDVNIVINKKLNTNVKRGTKIFKTMFI